MQEVAKAVPSKSKIIVMCNRGLMQWFEFLTYGLFVVIGGTLETIIRTTGAKPKECKDPDRAFGRETRSLKAIYELFQVQFFSEGVCFVIDLFFVLG